MKNFFSPKELDTLKDTDFLHTKAVVLEKLQSSLVETEQEIHHAIHSSQYHFPEGTFEKSGKISRGENYRQLPYLILDYPRLFLQDSIFAYRTMCWWGNFFSCTLHLQGYALEKTRQTIQKNAAILSRQDYYFCISQDPWNYTLEKNNYVLLDSMSHDVLCREIQQKKFLKFSRVLALEDYAQLPAFAKATFYQLMDVCSVRE